LTFKFTNPWLLIKTFILWECVNSRTQYQNFNLNHDFKLEITNVIKRNSNISFFDKKIKIMRIQVY